MIRNREFPNLGQLKLGHRSQNAVLLIWFWQKMSALSGLLLLTYEITTAPRRFANGINHSSEKNFYSAMDYLFSCIALVAAIEASHTIIFGFSIDGFIQEVRHLVALMIGIIPLHLVMRLSQIGKRFTESLHTYCFVYGAWILCATLIYRTYATIIYALHYEDLRYLNEYLKDNPYTVDDYCGFPSSHCIFWLLDVSEHYTDFWELFSRVYTVYMFLVMCILFSITHGITIMGFIICNLLVMVAGFILMVFLLRFNEDGFFDWFLWLFSDWFYLP